MPYEKKTYEPPSICWKCKNAVPDGKYGCSWSRRFQPVEGWDAKPTLVKNTSHRKGFGSVHFNSYRVKGCPKFIPDKKEEKRVAPWDDGVEVLI